MRLPNLSESMYVARLRYIQSVHETPERRNPDTLVRYFLPRLQRYRWAWLGRETLERLRAEPFYYYLVARTRYYDQVVTEAVAAGVRRIVGIGCGSDTRVYRFTDLLRSKGVRVLECDQAAAISAKERLAKRWGPPQHVEYLPIDLNDAAWPGLARWLGSRTAPKTLVMMEGVSPYVNADTFAAFLRFLAETLPPASHVAYDFKIRGASDDFGRVGRTHTPFRLSPSRAEVEKFHAGQGLRLERMETSAELTRRLVLGASGSESHLFGEDMLVRLVNEA